MANQITDNRTKRADAANITDGISGTWVGSTSPAQDTDVYIEGAASIAEQMTNSVRYVMWNAGTTLDLSNTHVYIWVNCGVVGLLTSKATGGFRIRFAGPTATDFFEVYVGGNDSWPNAVAGGWVQFCVDVVAAQASPSNTGGTPPAITAIQHIGYAAITSAMTKVADNTWVDAIWTLADGTPGIIVEGRSGGTTPWTFSDIFTQLGQAAGCFRPGPSGTWVINTPLQIGINDTTTHQFSDTNAIVLWDNQEFAASDLYSFSALGNSGGTTNVTLGVKTGSGDTATGAQGVIIAAGATGVRWAMDFDDPNLDSVGFYGCSFQHGGVFQLDDPAVEVISTLYIDCTQAVVGQNSLQLKNSIIQPANGDGVAFMQTDDMLDIRFCSFEFLDGHAVEITDGTVDPQENRGNLFSGFSTTPGSTDAAIYNNSASDLTINNTNNSNLNVNSYRNGTSSTTTIQNSVSVTITVQDTAGSPIQGARVFLETTPGGVDVITYATTNASGQVSATYSGSTPQAVTGYVRKGSWAPVYKSATINDTIAGTGLSATITLVSDE